MKKIILLSAAVITATNLLFSQGAAINSTGVKADTSAILDVSSTVKGILAPRMSEAQKNAISLPATSLIIYQTDGTYPGYYLNTGSPAAPVWSFLTISTHVQNNSLNYAAATGAANAYSVTLDPAPAAYIAGMIVSFKANAANTGAATLDVNGLGTVEIKKQVSSGLAADDILSGQIVSVIYDGANFQMLSQSGNTGGGSSCPQAGAAGSISGNSVIVPGSSGNVYTVPAVTNATDYHWTLPFGAYITSGFNTDTITVSFTNDVQAGDFYVYGFNYCSHGTMSAALTATPGSPLKVFVSSAAQNSTETVANRDALCQSDASGAGLSGTYKSWIANSGVNNVSSTTYKYYIRVDSVVIADDWADLTDGTLDNPLNLTASGSGFHGNVWTGLNASGTVSGIDCSNWTSTAVNGTYGHTDSTSSKWTSYGTNSCGSSTPSHDHGGDIHHVFDGCTCSGAFGPTWYPSGTEPGYVTLQGWDKHPACGPTSNGHDGWIKCWENITTATQYRHYCVQQ